MYQSTKINSQSLDFCLKLSSNSAGIFVVCYMHMVGGMTKGGWRGRGDAPV